MGPDESPCLSLKVKFHQVIWKWTVASLPCGRFVSCSIDCDSQTAFRHVPVVYSNDNVRREMPNVAAQVIMGGYASHEEASTVEVDKNGQALSSWLRIVRLVDAYGDLVAIWSWDGLVCDAFYWDLRLEVPALHHMPVLHVRITCLCYMSEPLVCVYVCIDIGLRHKFALSQYMMLVLTAVSVILSVQEQKAQAHVTSG